MILAFKKLLPENVAPAHAILKICGEHLYATLGMDHWYPPYPLEKMKRNAAERDVYLAEDERGVPVATFTLGFEDLYSYDLTIFPIRACKPIYLNRLGVLPDLQGKGIGHACMIEIERLARAAGCDVIRFDCITAHTQLVEFYKRLGYNECLPAGKAGAHTKITDWRGRVLDVSIFEMRVSPSPQ